MSGKPPPSGLFSVAKPARRSGFGWGLTEGRMISLTEEDSPELSEVLQTLKESGISKGHLEWIIAGVPGRGMADGLVELYFRDIDWTRYKSNRPSFMRRYTAFFDSFGRSPSNPRLDAETLKWLPLLFIVLAISTLSAPPDLIKADNQIAWSQRFYGSARSSLEYAKALQKDNLDILFAGLLASRYMLLTRRPAEGSTPLTTAFQLGLYRDGTILNLIDKREIEIRRRAWAMLYHLDRTISLLVGRPASISDAHTDTRMPANLDDEELEGDFDPAGHPMTQPTVYTYVVVRHKLAEIMGRIAYHTFAIQLPEYSTVLNLDRELLLWRESLPAFLSISNPDTSLDSKYSYLLTQRHLLACEWFYTRITLNRPYLLRRKPHDGRYSYSKDAAIESATADLLSRRDFVMAKGHIILASGGYRVLNSYMVLGVTIKLDPDSPQADELRVLLNIVSGRAPDSQGRVSEPLIKEELAIVEFLTAKSSKSKTSQFPTARREQAQDDQTPVGLLLGLAKTRSGKRAAEEEQRQLRLQQSREVEEQRTASSARVGGMISPWGYIAPQMPGLSVQQPFGIDGPRRAPRPLQPPPMKRTDPSDWSPGLLDSIMGSPSLHSQRQPPAISPDGEQYPSSIQQISPYQSMTNMSLASPGQQMLSLPQQYDDNQLFGTAGFGGFEFGDLSLPSLHAGVDPSQFNPFALAQTVEEGSGSEGMDEDTQFLNYILTKIANSQPEVQ
ncbi:MAG: hypothetical protein TREMPRED_001854 [Tremellales sp. Tagirdzhanova-0007]|nr:MAG: hypothetical protein TREMPRED_001854 [Tremellales sp. Tagirdzhanova-0007]